MICNGETCLQIDLSKSLFLNSDFEWQILLPTIKHIPLLLLLQSRLRIL